ncbi:MAG TPA: DUF1616 domain-containing protein [Candidatus Thermoplasmatota archaeon]|nr:DUF1616 domain-containing protein [Candidatus Thermoplasmatota archaeon]
MLPRVEASLLWAVAAPAGLLALVMAAPDALALRAPVALAAIVWAPGHAGLAILHPLRSPRLSGLERAALALAWGLLAAPVVGLAISVAWSLTALHVALVYLALTTALAGLAARRAARPNAAAATPQEASPRLAAPGTRTTLALSGAALLVAAAIFAVPLLAKAPQSAALSLGDAAGAAAGLGRSVAAGTPLGLVLRLDAGGAARDGPLTATLTGHNGTTVLLRQAVHLAPGGQAQLALAVPPLPQGSYRLEVRWDLPQPRTLHAWLDAGGPDG